MNDELNNIPESSDPSTGQELANVGQKAVQAGTQAKNLALGMKNGISNKNKDKKDDNKDKKSDKDKKDGQNNNDDLSNNETSSSLDSAKGLGKKAAKKGGKLAKDGAKKAGEGIKKIWQMIPTPYNWFVLGGIVLLFFLFLIILMLTSNDSTSEYAESIEGAFLCNMVDPTSNHYTASSKFGWRIHPVYNYAKVHTGVDLGGTTGESVYAVQSGTVTTANYVGNIINNCNYGYGNYIVIDHGNGYSTLYGHLSSINVKYGDSVSQGEKIGELGSTGCSTGPHLHFEVKYNGVQISPNAYFGYSDDGFSYCTNISSTPSASEASYCQTGRTAISFDEFEEMCTADDDEGGDITDFMKFQNHFEGGTSSSYACTTGGESGYKVYDDGLGYATTAYGFTWMRISVLINRCSNLRSVFSSKSDFYVGKCIPNSIFTDLVECNKEYATQMINYYFKNYCGYTPDFTSYEMDALIDFYHSGDKYTMNAASYYCSSGESAMLNYIKQTNLGYSQIAHRRECEIELYKNGDYTCNGEIN